MCRAKEEEGESPTHQPTQKCEGKFVPTKLFRSMRNFSSFVVFIFALWDENHLHTARFLNFKHDKRQRLLLSSRRKHKVIMVKDDNFSFSSYNSCFLSLISRFLSPRVTVMQKYVIFRKRPTLFSHS